MSFKGYKYSFKLNASHSLNPRTSMDRAHFHTFEITVYAQKQNDSFISYDVIEKKVEEYLAQFSGKYLNQISPFNKIEPTIENIGQVFYDNIKQLLNDGELWRLDINETPSRIFSIKEKLEENNISNSLRGQKLHYVIKNIEENSIKKSLSKERIEPPKRIVEPFVKVHKIIDVKQLLATNHTQKVDTRFLVPKFIAAEIFILICAFLFIAYLKNTGFYPLGYDIYGQLFKSNLLYESIKGENFYPLYNNLWYNGIEPFRYTAPLPYYLAAFLQFFLNSNLINSYLLFIGTAFSIGAFGWLIWGYKHNRIFLCTILGIAWFFLPDIARGAFSEGNISIILVNCILPYLLFFLWNFVIYKKRNSIYPLIIFTVLLALSNIVVSIVISAAILILLVITAIINKNILESLCAIFATLLSYWVIGLWLIPALKDGFGKLSMNVLTEIKKYSSFDYIKRINGDIDFYYVGIFILIISVAGIFLSKKKSIIAFLMSALTIITTIVLSTSILSGSLGGKLLLRLTPFAYSLTIIALLEWKSCKKFFMILFCLLIIADTIPSFYFDTIIKNMNDGVTYNNKDEYLEALSLDTAKQITRQRISIVDINSFGTYPSFEICTGENSKQYTYGSNFREAATLSDFEMINTAFVKEYFDYVFDKNIEMGADTVVLKKSQFENYEEAYPNIIKASENCGYTLIEDGEKSLVFHKDTPEVFGVVTQYEGIAIGTTASYITLIYPYFCSGNKIDIDDYSFEELKGYKKIYLSGFFYHNKLSAENLIGQLADYGIKIYIDMNKIPVDPITSRMTFLDASAQPIVFNNRFPDLILNNEIIHCDNFLHQYTNWNTVYIDNLKNIEGYSWFSNNKIPFIGTGKNENIIFLGFNLLFHAIETKDASVVKLMRDVIGIDDTVLPERKIIPLEIKYDNEKITINSPTDNVNTTIAYYDNLTSNSNFSVINNLIVVNKGITIIDIKYPYFIFGLIVSILGVILEFVLIYFINRSFKTYNLINK